MKKELMLSGMVAMASLSAFAHHGFWGRGGCHFWPGFAGGVVGGMIGGWGWGRTVVIGAPAYYTTPVVVQQQPVVVQQPQQQVQAQPVQAQPAVQTVRAPACSTPNTAKETGTTVYVDTNGNQRVVGELLIDGKGNKMLPANYRVIRVDDLTRQ